jgi:hypothetical protein
MGAPFHLSGTWYAERGSYTEAFDTDKRRALMVGHLSMRDSMKGSFTEEPAR